MFSSEEAKELHSLLKELKEDMVHEKLIETTYPIFMYAYGIQLDV